MMQYYSMILTIIIAMTYFSYKIMISLMHWLLRDVYYDLIDIMTYANEINV